MIKYLFLTIGEKKKGPPIIDQNNIWNLSKTRTF